MHNSYQDADSLYLILEYASRGDLFHLIRDKGEMNVEHAKSVFVQTVLALDHIHSQGLIYR